MRKRLEKLLKSGRVGVINVVRRAVVSHLRATSVMSVLVHDAFIDSAFYMILYLTSGDEKCAERNQLVGQQIPHRWTQSTTG